jgi:transposase
MFLYISKRRYQDRVYEYAQICESGRVNGRPVRRVLGNLGRVDQLDRAAIDGLIASLRRLGSPAGAGVGLEEAEVLQARHYGPILAARRLWEQLGLSELIEPGEQRYAIQEALFRLVANRLVAPQSKRSTVDWQAQVEWPQPAELEYQHFLRAMDVLQGQQERLEEALFGRVRQLFSVPLQLVWYDLTSSYFEGEGVCELAAYGHSRDHRSARAQLVLGLALTQEGFPIAHHVYPGNTADVTTVAHLAQQLKERFGLPEAIVVGDRGLLSADNAQRLDELQLRYVLALRTRQQGQAAAAVSAALAAGLERPGDPEAPWTVQEVAPLEGQRRVVVYSAFRAAHERDVREKRLEQARQGLSRLQAQVRQGRLKDPRSITERATRLLSRARVAKYFRWSLAEGHLHFQLRQEVYAAQQQLDGMLVLVSNAPEPAVGGGPAGRTAQRPALRTAQIVAAYRQLHQVEDAFRVLKSLLKLRPIYHWTARRVEAHIFICVLAYLLAARLEQRLAQAGLQLTAARALEILDTVMAVEHRWGQGTVTQMTRPSPEARQLLQALGLSDLPRILHSDLTPDAA